MRLMVVISAVAVVVAAFVAADPSATPGTWPLRFIFTLLLEALAVFVVAGVRRLIADSRVVDDHPDQELPLMRDRRGHVIGAAPFGQERGLEAFEKDLIDDDEPEPGTADSGR